MRTFSSSGPIDKDFNYFAPRTELIQHAYTQLIGENPEQGGHYLTVWAPRQTGKTWIMLEVLKRLKAHPDFEVAMFAMQSAQEAHTDQDILEEFSHYLRLRFGHDLPTITSWRQLSRVFTPQYFNKPVILIIDEFDACKEEFINKFANEFRSMYLERLNDAGKTSKEEHSLLHGLALIGVRSVLGIENMRGSPFNVQRSLHIPNLTSEEVARLFNDYQQESGQTIDPDVVDRIFYEFNGQPGLTCWFGHLLTEEYNQHPDEPITMQHFRYAFMWATQGLPNNNILNIVSKARQAEYKDTVLNLFQTDQKLAFSYDEPHLNFLYMNGVIDVEVTPERLYAKFPSPFVQKRLFNYFSRELFPYLGKLTQPFETVEKLRRDESLQIDVLLRYYQVYINANAHWLFKGAPRRADLRIYEAVFHFNFYLYCTTLLEKIDCTVWPEFPTGNGKIDILINDQGTLHGIELKTFSDLADYKKAIQQAAAYGNQLHLQQIWLVFFIERIDEQNRGKYEALQTDPATGVTVRPIFIETGE